MLDRAEVGLGLDRSLVVGEAGHGSRHAAPPFHPAGGKLIEGVGRHIFNELAAVSPGWQVTVACSVMKLLHAILTCKLDLLVF